MQLGDVGGPFCKMPLLSSQTKTQPKDPMAAVAVAPPHAPPPPRLCRRRLLASSLLFSTGPPLSSSLSFSSLFRFLADGCWVEMDDKLTVMGRRGVGWSGKAMVGGVGWPGSWVWKRRTTIGLAWVCRVRRKGLV